MGYNSVVFICNDGMYQIEKDPAGWWKKTWDQLMIQTFKSSKSGEDGSYGFGNHCGGFQAVWNEHADVTCLIAVGGNYATVLPGRVRWSDGDGHHTPEGQVQILKAVASKLGYDLRKKKSKK